MTSRQITATYFGATDTGRVRTNNEDNLIACELWGGTHLLLAAIDGIGGYEGGEVAAQIARDVIIDVVSSGSETDCLNLLKQAVTEANNAIVEHKRADAERSRMGCVISSAIIALAEARIYMVHIGDSRLYQYTESEGLRKLSHDHSLVGYREEIGMLTEEQAMHHPQRNIIERSLGDEMHSPDDDGFLDAGIFPILGSTQLLFCSDGLSDMLYSAEIAAVLATDASAREEVTKLIDRANDAGGKDNVTVVIAKINVPATQPIIASDTEDEAIRSAFSSPLPPADNSDDLLAPTEEIRIPEAVPAGNASAPRKRKLTVKRFNIYLISVAAAFIIGGTIGYFIGYHTAGIDTEKAIREAREAVPDSIISVINDPTDSIANPQQLGEQSADSANAAYQNQINSHIQTDTPHIQPAPANHQPNQ